MLVRVRRIDWPMLAESLQGAGVGHYSVRGTYDGWVYLHLPWNVLVTLNKLVKQQRAKMRFDLAA